MTKSVILITSDDLGWPETSKFTSESEARQYVEDNVEELEDYFPAPIIITSDMKVIQFDNFRYC